MDIIQMTNWYFAILQGFSYFSINSKLFLSGSLLDRQLHKSHNRKLSLWKIFSLVVHVNYPELINGYYSNDKMIFCHFARFFIFLNK